MRILIMFLLVIAGISFGSRAEDKPLKIHFISGSAEYKSEPSLTQFQNYLETNHKVEITWSKARDGGTECPNIEGLDQCDVLLIFCRRLKLNPVQTEKIKAYCTSGKPIVSLRTASHGFQSWLALDKEVMGGDYQGHFGNETVAVIPTAAAKEHPVTKDIGTWESIKLYKVGTLAPDVSVLQHGEIVQGKTGEKATHAVTWIREYKGARMFYSSLGTPKDFENENFRKMLANALFWCARR